jgi:hypothetical protein
MKTQKLEDALVNFFFGDPKQKEVDPPVKDELTLDSFTSPASIQFILDNFYYSIVDCESVDDLDFRAAYVACNMCKLSPTPCTSLKSGVIIAREISRLLKSKMKVTK